MPTELLNLELDELSLVPKGANPMAKAPIFKADTSNGEDMTETVIKMSEEMDKKIKDYMKANGCDRATAESAMMKSFDEAEVTKADFDRIKLENEKLRKSLLDEGYTIEADKVTKAAAVEFVEYDGEKINKADIPGPILKALEAAEVAKADAELTTKAEATLPHFDLAVAKSLMTAVSKMSDAEVLIAALQAADKAFEDKMQEFGKSSTDGDFTSAKDKLDHMTKAYAEEHKVDYIKAYAKVAETAEGKALINKSYKDKE